MIKRNKGFDPELTSPQSFESELEGRLGAAFRIKLAQLNRDILDEPLPREIALLLEELDGQIKKPFP